MENYYEYVVAVKYFSGEWKIKHFNAWTGSERDFLMEVLPEDTSVRLVRVLEVIPHSKMKL